MSDFLSRDLAAIIHFNDKNKTIVCKFRYIFFLFFNLSLCESISIFET